MATGRDLPRRSIGKTWGCVRYLFRLGWFVLRFYSLAYLLGVLFAYWHLSKHDQSSPARRWRSATRMTCSSTARWA
jgi:prolipoprotein diacylglyceryltransferase